MSLSTAGAMDFAASPQPGRMFAGLSLLSVCFNALLVGGFLRLSNQGEESFLAIVGCVVFAWLAWMQLLGTFRPSIPQAIAAANWQVGIASLLAIHLVAWFMIAASVVSAAHGLATIVTILFLVWQAMLNLRWARQLQRLEWQPPARWHFSLRELLVLTLACAATAGGYRLAEEPLNYYRPPNRARKMANLDELPRASDEDHRRSAIPGQS